jgi:predicted DCC family thiol-disulfide oxidoreductase YuxK
VFWVRRWQRIIGDRVKYLPFQDGSLLSLYPELTGQPLETAIHIIETDGSVWRGAEAAFRALAHMPRDHWLLGLYVRSPLFARATEWAYKLVAGHRRLFSALTLLGWGRSLDPPTYQLVRWVFLRSLGIIYLIAFLSLSVQITGLVSSHGILPAKLSMQGMRQEMDAAKVGTDRYRLAPTLCWITASDNSLRFQCATGIGLSLLLIVGVAPALSLFLLWLIYLSLATICGEFLGFQWDILLLETGFLGIFFAPLQLFPRITTSAPPSRLVLWLFRWLLFKLMFESGCVKLLSGDPSWRNLTALTFHYETQPLPTWLGWYAHQLPAWCQKTSTALMFGAELVLPFFVFMPRRFRQIAGAGLAGFQVFIMLTGNYCFFNLLTIALCALWLDDATIRRIAGCLPFREILRITNTLKGGHQTDGPKLRRLRWPIQVTFPLACIAIVTSLLQLSMMFRVRFPWPQPVVAVFLWLEPFRSFNSYGLFAVMTKSRPEIIIEGSDDGVRWREYEFKYKPGDLKQHPRFVEPHQPRLDWQMWFAALSDYQHNPWLVNFCARILQGSPEVMHLLKGNPFPKAPPRYIRAVVYDYHFTTIAVRRQTRAWWRRTRKGDYLPMLSLRDFRT